MEIYTQNLIGVTLQESRLQSNFSFIDSAIKNINQQLITLHIAQDSMLKSHSNSKNYIEAIVNRLNNQQNQISSHSKWIQQMNAQFQLDCFDIVTSSEKQLKSYSNNDSHKQITISKIAAEKPDGLNYQQKKQKLSDSNMSNIEKSMIASGSKVVGKNSLERTLNSLKERLATLERQMQVNRAPIDEMSRILSRQKLREEQHSQKRSSNHFSNKKRSLVKNCLTEESKKEGQILEGELKRSSERSFEGNVNEFFDLFAAKNLLDTPEYDKLDVASKEMTKEMQSLKQNIIDKIRSIQAQYKENQNRIGTIEKSVDVIQRSYEMLRYDFDRTTTTGWSRQKTNDTHQRGKRDKLNQSRITNREHYEEKMVEIFQEMDKLKKEYIELMSRLEGEDPSQIGQILNRDNEETNGKLNNYRLVSSIRNDGQSKRQVAMLKKDLSKLRLDFEQFAWGVNTNGDTKTVVIKPNQTKQDWKALSTKIYKLRMQLQAGVRQLQGKIVTNNDMVVVLNQLEVGIEQCKLLIKRKVEQSDYQKGLKRVQARLNNFIMQVYEKQGKEQETEAAMARQPWFCLSCDNQVKSYAGKPQKSPNAEKLQGKKVNPQSHMVRRNENGRLPSVLK